MNDLSLLNTGVRERLERAAAPWRRGMAVPAIILVLSVACSFWLYVVVSDAVESVARRRAEARA